MLNWSHRKIRVKSRITCIFYLVNKNSAIPLSARPRSRTIGLDYCPVSPSSSPPPVGSFSRSSSRSSICAFRSSISPSRAATRLCPCARDIIHRFIFAWPSVMARCNPVISRSNSAILSWFSSMARWSYPACDGSK